MKSHSKIEVARAAGVSVAFFKQLFAYVEKILYLCGVNVKRYFLDSCA